MEPGSPEEPGTVGPHRLPGGSSGGGGHRGFQPQVAHLLLRSCLGPVLSAAALLVLVGGALQLSALILRSAVVPGVDLLARILVPLAAPLLVVVLPVAVFVGVAVGLGRWVENGTWTGLRSLGVGGRGLVGPALGLALAGAVATAVTTLALAPEGRRQVARVLLQAAGQVRLVPGHFLGLGDAVVLRRPGEGVFVVTEGVAVDASAGWVEAVEGGLVLSLEDGQAVGPGPSPFRFTFSRARFPLALPTQDRRVELEERSQSELGDLVRRMESAGRDASYEANVWLKRFTIPLAVPLLGLLAIPLGLRGSGRVLPLLLVILGYWVLIRVGDLACRQVGPWIAVSLAPAGLLAALGLAWGTWRDR